MANKFERISAHDGARVDLPLIDIGGGLFARAYASVNEDGEIADVSWIVPPLHKTAVYNTPELANTDVLPAVLTPQITPCMFRVQVAYSVAAILKARITNGATTYTLALNAGQPLAALALYVFDIQLETGDTVNFHFDTAGTVQVLYVDETSVWGP